MINLRKLHQITFLIYLNKIEDTLKSKNSFIYNFDENYMYLWIEL